MPDRTLAPEFIIPTELRLPEIEEQILSTGIKVQLISECPVDAFKLDVVFPLGYYHVANPAILFFALKMLVEGSGRFTDKEIASKLDFFGASIDVQAGFDQSTISLYGLNAHINPLLDLFTDILSNPSFDEARFAQLKNIKLEGIKLDAQKANAVSSKKMRALVYGVDHPYGASLEINQLMDADLLEKAKQCFQQELKDHFDLFLVCNDQSVVKETIAVFTNSVAAKKERSTKHAKNQQSGVELLEINFPDSVQSSIRMAKEMPLKTNADFKNIYVANVLLGGFFGSRLMKSIREEKGLTYGISSSIVPFANSSLLFIAAEIKKNTHEEVIAAIKHEITLLAEQPIAEEEVELLKNYLTGTIITKFSNPFKIADNLRELNVHGLNKDFYNKLLSAIKSTSPAGIQQSIRNYFDPGKLQAVYTT